MGTQFLFCQKCGTRNFFEDNECGICKNKLHAVSNPSLQSKSTRNKTSIGIWFLVIFMSIIGYYFIFWEDDKNTNSKQVVYNSTLDGSVYQVNDYLKNNYLNDPDSYQSISWSEVFKLNDAKELGFASYQVRHKFRAKNSFGGYIVEEKLFTLDYKGNVVSFKNYNK